MPYTTVTQAALDTGIPARTIRTLCSDHGLPLARRVGRPWLVDVDLLRELAEPRRPGRQVVAPVPSEPIRRERIRLFYRLAPDDAADILGIPSEMIRRWCRDIPALAIHAKGDRGALLIEPAILGLVAFHWRDQGTGMLPYRVLQRGSSRQKWLLHNLKKLLGRQNRGEDVLPVHYLAAVEHRIARRLNPPPDPAAAPVQPGRGEVGHDTR